MENKYQMQGAFAEMDDDIGWNDFALRNYDPQIGRWVQQDPYQEFASPYVGMGDDPVNLVDPSGGGVFEGLSPLVKAGVATLGGAIIGGFVDAISGGDGWRGMAIGAGIGLGLSFSANILQTINFSVTIINTSIKTANAGEIFSGTNEVPQPNPFPNETPGIDPKERLRILATIAMGEGGNGWTFTTNELVEIAYVYIHLQAKGKPLGYKSSFYGAKNAAYRMYMHVLGSPKYAKDKIAIKERKKIPQVQIDKAKEVLNELKCYLSPGSNHENIPAAENPNITIQGYYKDLNGERADPSYWNRVRWYVYFVLSGKIPKTNNVYVFLGKDNAHKNATFLVDENEVNKFVKENSDWIDTKQAPKYDPATAKFKE